MRAGYVLRITYTNRVPWDTPGTLHTIVSPPRDALDTVFRSVRTPVSPLHHPTVGVLRGGGLVMITAKWDRGQGQGVPRARERPAPAASLPLACSRLRWRSSEIIVLEIHAARVGGRTCSTRTLLIGWHTCFAILGHPPPRPCFGRDGRLTIISSTCNNTQHGGRTGQEHRESR